MVAMARVVRILFALTLCIQKHVMFRRLALRPGGNCPDTPRPEGICHGMRSTDALRRDILRPEDFYLDALRLEDISLDSLHLVDIRLDILCPYGVRPDTPWLDALCRGRYRPDGQCVAHSRLVSIHPAQHPR